jgi:hypothetical protein
MFGVDSIGLVVGGLLAGVAFGVLLQKGGVTRYATIVGQFLFTDYTVLKIMLTAILTGAVGVYGMLQLGWIDGLLVKPAQLAANAAGGLIFGVGMAGLGYCPGTGVGAAAEGSRHARVGLVGMIVGAALYTEAFPLLDAGFNRIGDLGKVTLTDLTGWSPWVFIGILGVISAAAFAAIARHEAAHPVTD